jgi:putative transposase
MSKSDCDLHAYVIMRNHLHLLITPTDKTQLSRYMQTMANRYVRIILMPHGTGWELYGKVGLSHV